DEFLLILQNLPHVCIKGIFRHIPEDLHLLVLVSLPENTSLLLFQIRRLPGTVQMMESDQPVLNIRSRPKFWCGADQDTHLPGAYLCKQFCLFCLCPGFM